MYSALPYGKMATLDVIVKTFIFIFMVLVLNNFEGILSEKAHFGYPIDVEKSRYFQTIETFPNTSYSTCIKRCKQTNNCKYVNYDRLQLLCCLIEDLGNRGRRIPRIRKPGSLRSERQEWTQTNNISVPNIETGCTNPPQAFETYILGNMNKVGSKMKVTCSSNANVSYVFICRTGNVWKRLYIQPRGEKPCYHLVLSVNNWEYAKMNCELLGGHLADIRNAEEMADVNAYLNKVNDTLFLMPGQKIFIGLNSRADKNVYRDHNNARAYYFNWAPNQPSDTGIERCVEITKNRMWNDVKCTDKRLSLCQL